MRNTLIITTLALMTRSAPAAMPTLGGPMSHLLVTLFDQQIYIGFESPSMSTVTMQDHDADFTGSASVLNGSGYNAQFGWLTNGFISLPPGAGIFVRTLASSRDLRVYEQSSFASILGTDSSSDTWRWDGTMTHNWYATEIHGPHFARYEVFVGDLSGNPLEGYQSGFVELRFQYGPDLAGRVLPLGAHGANASVPAPGALGVLTLSTAFTVRRRRTA